MYIYIYVYTQTWEFPKMGVPKDGWFIMDNPSINEWFRGTPIWDHPNETPIEFFPSRDAAWPSSWASKVMGKSDEKRPKKRGKRREVHRISTFHQEKDEDFSMNGFFSFDFSRNGKCWKFGCLAFVQKRISPYFTRTSGLFWNVMRPRVGWSPAGVQGVTPNKHRETIITASSGVSSLSSLEKQKGSITKTGWLSQGPNNTRNWWFDQAKWGWS